MKHILYSLLVILFISCASPESDGREAARDENRNAENCIESIQKLESDFVTNFNPADYSCRSQAIEAYKNLLNKIADNYFHGIDAAEIQKSKLKGKYADDYKKNGRI